MIAIMISIKPYWYAKILNGKKSIEVRKNKALAKAIQKLIDTQGYAPILGYCTKERPYLFNTTFYCREGLACCHEIELEKAIKHIRSKPHYGTENPFDKNVNNSHIIHGTPYGNVDEKRTYLNGKVPALLICRKAEEIYIRYGEGWVCGNLRIKEIEKETCLSRYELYDYLKNNRSRGYAIHISQLEIFDKPKELDDFVRWYPYYKRPYERITKAPQNYCYVEVEE